MASRLQVHRATFRTSFDAEEFCLLISLALYVVANIFGSVNVMTIVGVSKGSISLALQLFGLVVVMLGYMLGAAERRPGALLVIGLIVAVCSYAVTKTPIILWLFLLCGLGSSTTMRRAAGTVCITTGIMLMLVLLANRMGVIPSVFMYGSRIRNSLGFIHPNNLGLVVSVFVISLTMATA